MRFDGNNGADAMSDAGPSGATLHTLSVEAPQAGTRLDKWLAEALADVSRSRLKTLIEEGAVSDGTGAVRDPSRKVRAGECFRLVVPPATPAVPEAEAIALCVVFEDEHLIVVDKSAGMAVHPAPGSSTATLVNALLHHCASSLSGIGGVKRPGIVHRLDKGTSGLIVAAKTDAAHAALARQFAEHSITRAYRAICWGIPTPPVGEISGNIGRSPNDRKKMAVVEQGGKVALTRYRVQRLLGQSAAVVECRLATGRTHQIRVHLASIGHPLIGDPLYGRGLRNAQAKALPPAARNAAAGFGRQALHAYLLGFLHPASAERLVFRSDEPADFNGLINSLEKI
jgi:23S rRNA pseudouridine1911/1915/1917 synthase